MVFPKNKKTLPADCGKVTPSRHQSLRVETGNHAFGVVDNDVTCSTVGYLRDMAEPLKESQTLKYSLPLRYRRHGSVKKVILPEEHGENNKHDC